MSPDRVSAFAAVLCLGVVLPAQAASPLEHQGDTALADCLDQRRCGDRATRLLGESMSEYGLVLQSDPMGTSALTARGAGPVFEIRVDTATMGRDNKLEEQIMDVPGLPRISGGWLLGSNAWSSSKPQVAFGGTVLPSIRVRGGLMSTVQTDGSIAVPLGTPLVWAGAEVGYGTGVVELPLLATDQQWAALESATGAEVERTDACEEGCLDRLRQNVATGRLGLSIEPAPSVFLFSRVALAGVTGRLEVDYDQSTWTLRTLQVQSQSGGGIRAGNFQLTMGAVVVPRSQSLATSQEKTMAKVTASSSLRLGGPRVRQQLVIEEDRFDAIADNDLTTDEIDDLPAP